ncbi:DUF4176 domain-containing protein [Sporosarcina sp. 6E9]|uniref:DUF4176 domain-containing protein n=1 Tax=Sporosarcina sp. 6E9 TaxID=2819235 RepID=UPI001B309B17|nr:DUF4176 domain-containing protein [Sporosarcina sp. 6E9]
MKLLPLYNNGGTIGYFDYGACLYPNGQVDQKTFFFNEADIEDILIETVTILEIFSD